MTQREAGFPRGFAWGAATSSAQSEGGIEAADWRIWERSGRAPECGAGNRKRDWFEEDFTRLSELGLTHFRTSVEWSRLEPERGVYNREELERTRLLLEAARRKGMTVWLSLHHFTLPAWFSRQRGFLDEAALMYWHRLVEMLARELKESVDFWLPVIEPNYYALGSNLLGKFPPGQKRLDKFNDMMAAAHRAHGDAYQILKSYLPARAKVGMNLLVVPVEPRNPESDSDQMAAEFIDGCLNRFAFQLLKEGAATLPGKGLIELKSVKGAADFVGADYFFRLIVSRERREDAGACLAELMKMEGMPGLCAGREGDPITESGAGAHPEGLYEAVKKVYAAGLDKPIYITASGVATADENLRQSYLAASLKSVNYALEQGLDIRGYFHWSDVDAYEWNEGYNLHYGLFGFDPATGERRIRPAAYLLGKVARGGSLPREIPAPAR